MWYVSNPTLVLYVHPQWIKVSHSQFAELKRHLFIVSYGTSLSTTTWNQIWESSLLKTPLTTTKSPVTSENSNSPLRFGKIPNRFSDLPRHRRLTNVRLQQQSPIRPPPLVRILISHCSLF